MTGPAPLRGTRGEIMTLLRQARLTANEIAARLGVTHNAIRGHLAALEQEGLIRGGGRQRGVSRPAVIYEVVPEAESVFSKAYIPFVAQLVRVLRERVSQAELDAIMRAVGERLAQEWPRLSGDLSQRVKAASALLEELGGLNQVEEANGGYLIRGHGCLLAAAVEGRPEVCRAMAALLGELIETPVRECCDRGARPSCRFEIGAAARSESG